jgi:hypothetical protein
MSNIAAPRRVNQRLTARRTCHLHVAYRTDKEWHPATAMDLSRNGVRLRLGEELRRDGPVSVLITHTHGDGSTTEAHVEGTIIWWRLEGLSYQAGIHFPKDSPALHEILSSLE